MAGKKTRYPGRGSMQETDKSHVSLGFTQLTLVYVDINHCDTQLFFYVGTTAFCVYVYIQ